ncbi:MAG: hypothetical protein GSR72_03930 [Desulfurococcales archaeon]|nr:hypothetical protein [Desulfurococcales archaeon]MEB3789023.1 hypothetical protein [Desulfurococcales archaeon]
MIKENPCISIATDDGIKVKIGHFGDAKYYFHYVLDNKGRPVLIKIIENIYKDEEEHGHHHGNEEKREKIHLLNKYCQIIVTTFLGPGGEEYMENHGIKVVKVRPGTRIEEALKQVYGPSIKI